MSARPTPTSIFVAAPLVALRLDGTRVNLYRGRTFTQARASVTSIGLADLVIRAKATLYDAGTGVMLIMRGPGGFTGGRVIDAMVSHLDIYPTLCDLAGAPHPHFIQGASLIPLVHGEIERVHDLVFTEMTYHAAYEPLRAVRSSRWKYIRRFHDYDHPVLANCDDSATKEALVERGWASQPVPVDQLFDLAFDPNEACNVAQDPAYREILATMRERLDSWMEETDDPIRHGPIPAPPGAYYHDPSQASPNDSPRAGVPA